MLFNSFEFLFFLPIVFFVYWALQRWLRVQNLFVVVASYVFYGWWNWKFLLLIGFVSIVSFLSGLSLERWKNSRKLKKFVVTLCIILCIGTLFTFKYFNFFSHSFGTLMAAMGINLDIVTLQLVLPVGISFYTLQALSYTIDIYRGKYRATKDVVSFFAYISFFPQLVAGPIERASNLLPQFQNTRVFSYPKAVEGMQQILWGLFKKMVVADNCANNVNYIFENYASLDGGMLLWGIFFFSFQIYGDFSGYSDIAIGSARLFGINLSRNFHFPYLSRNVAEFWRRWHISLNRWFVEYVYIPLGGSRGSMTLTIFNTMVIFMLSGFWHGADWTYITWGFVNGLLFIPIILLGTSKKYRNSVVAQDSVLPKLVEIIQLFTTFGLISFTRIFSRSQSVADAFEYIKRIFSNFSFSFPDDCLRALFSVFILFVIEYLQRRREFGLQLPHSGVLRFRIVRWGVYYFFFLLLLFVSETPKEFIYFQF